MVAATGSARHVYSTHPRVVTGTHIAVRERIGREFLAIEASGVDPLAEIENREPVVAFQPHLDVGRDRRFASGHVEADRGRHAIDIDGHKQVPT
jgi:hypothetical protein